MKHITLFTLAFAAAFSGNAQVVFTSGVEDWTGALPDDFVGSKTNLPADSISIEGAMQHSGDFAVRLKNSNAGHRRFTTQPLNVIAGTTYEISFWVRGVGQIRTGLFDGRSTGSGYASYNNYVNATTAWTQVTQTIACTHDTTDGEFIFSIRNDATTLVGEILLDDVSISVTGGTGPTTMAIYDIQYTTAPDGSSPAVNTEVITSGIATAVGGGGYFLQDGTGAWNGIFVNDATNTPALGDEVRVTATVQENFNLTRLNNVTLYEVLSTGNALPAPTVISTADANTEPFESVLIKVAVATCTDPNSGFGQWIINDGSGPVFVDDLLFPYTPVLNAVYDVTGPLFFSFSEWKILPRDANDIQIVTGMHTPVGDSGPQVWPVPADQELFVSTSVRGTGELELLDATGRSVWSGTITGELMRVATTGLPTGAYTLVLDQGGHRTTSRVLIQH